MVLAQFAQTNDWDGLNSFPDNQHIILNKIVFYCMPKHWSEWMIECGDRKSARFNNMRVFMQTHYPTIKTNHILSSTHVHVSCVRWIVQLNKFNAILTKSERYMQLKWKLFILISKNVKRSWTVLNMNWILEENFV